MGEEISVLVDGELDESRVELAYRRLNSEDVRRRWNCYHVIGDCLRLADTSGLPASAAFVAAGLRFREVVFAAFHLHLHALQRAIRR